jgi:hypothetical protein
MIRSTDIYPPQSLSEALQNLMQLCLRHISAPRPMQLESIAGMHASLRDCHRMALQLEDRARDAADLEAIARDIEMAMVPEALARSVVLPEPLARLVAHHVRDQQDALTRDLMGYAAHGAPGPVLEVHDQGGDVSLVKLDRETLAAEQRALQDEIDAEDVAKIVQFQPRPRRVPLSTCGIDDDGDAA